MNCVAALPVIPICMCACISILTFRYNQCDHYHDSVSQVESSTSECAGPGRLLACCSLVGNQCYFKTCHIMPRSMTDGNATLHACEIQVAVRVDALCMCVSVSHMLPQLLSADKP